MKEFLLLIRNQIAHQSEWSSEKHQQFLGACETYIGNLKKQEKLKAAQPLIREGKMISGTPASWKEAPFNEQGEVIVGYYHVLAKDLDEAIAIAKGNPEFQFGSTARVEVRPIKMKEEATGFVYPKK